MSKIGDFKAKLNQLLSGSPHADQKDEQVKTTPAPAHPKLSPSAEQNIPLPGKQLAKRPVQTVATPAKAPSHNPRGESLPVVPSKRLLPKQPKENLRMAPLVNQDQSHPKQTIDGMKYDHLSLQFFKKPYDQLTPIQQSFLKRNLDTVPYNVEARANEIIDAIIDEQLDGDRNDSNRFTIKDILSRRCFRDEIDFCIHLISLFESSLHDSREVNKEQPINIEDYQKNVVFAESSKAAGLAFGRCSIAYPNVSSVGVKDDLRTNMSYIVPETYQKRALKALSIDRPIGLLLDSIGQMQSLEHLIIESSRLTALPSAIGNLKNLKLLIINKAQISSLPDEITKLENLEDLRLMEAGLWSLPDNIGDLKSLKRLVLQNYMYLDNVPEEIIDKPEEYEKLFQIPESIGNLIHLEELEISELMPFRELPLSIVKLKNLKKLTIAPNLINRPELKQWIADLRANKCKIAGIANQAF